MTNYSGVISLKLTVTIVIKINDGIDRHIRIEEITNNTTNLRKIPRDR